MEMEPTAKVLFRIPNEDGTSEVETLWAYELGHDQYRLANTPFFAYGVSIGDVVFAPQDPDEGMATFSRVVTKSGYRTVRVVFNEPVEEGTASQTVLDDLVKMDCEYEGYSSRFLAIEIPPTVELSQVTDLLTHRNVQWEHADPTFEEVHGHPSG